MRGKVGKVATKDAWSLAGPLRGRAGRSAPGRRALALAGGIARAPRPRPNRCHERSLQLVRVEERHAVEPIISHRRTAAHRRPEAPSVREALSEVVGRVLCSDLGERRLRQENLLLRLRHREHHRGLCTVDCSFLPAKPSPRPRSAACARRTAAARDAAHMPLAQRDTFRRGAVMASREVLAACLCASALKAPAWPPPRSASSTD